MNLLIGLFFYEVNVLLDYLWNIIIFNCLVCVFSGDVSHVTQTPLVRRTRLTLFPELDWYNQATLLEIEIPAYNDFVAWTLYIFWYIFYSCKISAKSTIVGCKICYYIMYTLMFWWQLRMIQTSYISTFRTSIKMHEIEV